MLFLPFLFIWKNDTLDNFFYIFKKIEFSVCTRHFEKKIALKTHNNKKYIESLF